MENSKFSTVKKDLKVGMTVIKAGRIIYNCFGYGNVLHADANNQAQISISITGVETEPSTDVELFKVWNHATIERKHSVYASKELLKNELEKRGYVLSENSHRWKRTEIEA